MIVVSTVESFRGKPIRFYYKVTGRIPESLSEIDTKPTIKFLLNCIFPNPRVLNLYSINRILIKRLPIRNTDTMLALFLLLLF